MSAFDQVAKVFSDELLCLEIKESIPNLRLSAVVMLMPRDPRRQPGAVLQISP